MSDVKITLKGKRDEFRKDPKKVFEDLGLLKAGEQVTLKASAGAQPKDPSAAVHAHVLFAEGEG